MEDRDEYGNWNVPIDFCILITLHELAVASKISTLPLDAEDPRPAVVELMNALALAYGEMRGGMEIAFRVLGVGSGNYWSPEDPLPPWTDPRG